MGIENFEGSDYLEKEAAKFRMNKHETRMGDATDVDGNFGKFENGGLHRVSPLQLEDLRGSGSLLRYGNFSRREMQEQFNRFYANDQVQAPLDARLVANSFGCEGVTVVQDGNSVNVSENHELLRFAQENNQPYVPVHLYKISY